MRARGSCGAAGCKQKGAALRLRFVLTFDVDSQIIFLLMKSR